jgi:glycosyltransferase involved in cell wall biosynthesis
MHIGILSPTFPPDRCGVGDHSFRLVEAIRGLGHQVTRFADLRGNVSPDLKDQPDVFVIQYTPSLWGKNFAKLNFSLIPWIRKIKKHAPIVMIAHELNYPVGLTPRGLILGLGQKWIFNRLSRAVHWTFFSYREPQSRFPNRTSVLPVGSTIPRNTSFHSTQTDPQTRQKIRLLHFGGAHPTHLLPWTFFTLKHLTNAFPDKQIELHLVGISELQKNEILKSSDSSLSESIKNSVRARGYLPEKEVSYEITAADLVLAPFMDGISTRRSSFMSCLAHGTAILTTEGWTTDFEIPWDKFCAVAKNDLNEYAKKAESLLRDSQKILDLRAQSKIFYEDLFSWEKIAKQLVARLEKLKTETSHES